MAILGCGFDPGVTNIFCAYAQEELFDEIHTIDIIDCNAGSHGKAFATNFNPEINLREVTQRGKYWKKGEWIEIDPLSISAMVDYPEVGKVKSYLIYHEEEESLVENIKGLKQIRFWMTFSDNYIKHLDVLQNVGMTRIDPVNYKGTPVIPMEFLKCLLPEPSSLAENYTGKTSIGVVLKGEKNGKKKKYMIWNVCDHAETNKEVGAQAVSYTTGVPPVVGAMMMFKGDWKGPEAACSTSSSCRRSRSSKNSASRACPGTSSRSRRRTRRICSRWRRDRPCPCDYGRSIWEGQDGGERTHGCHVARLDVGRTGCSLRPAPLEI